MLVCVSLLDFTSLYLSGLFWLHCFFVPIFLFSVSNLFLAFSSPCKEQLHVKRITVAKWKGNEEETISHFLLQGPATSNFYVGDRRFDIQPPALEPSFYDLFSYTPQQSGLQFAVYVICILSVVWQSSHILFLKVSVIFYCFADYKAILAEPKNKVGTSDTPDYHSGASRHPEPLLEPAAPPIYPYGKFFS